MPLAVDHVQFSVPDVDQAAAYLVARGYRRRFQEECFDRVPAPFFRRPGKTMVYLVAPEARIELINGGPDRGDDGYIPVFLSGAPLAMVPELSAVCRGGVGTILNWLEVRVENLQSSLRFWQAMGFERQQSSSDGITLRFNGSAIGMELTLELTSAPAGDDREMRFVDDLGCSLVALVDQHIEATVKDAGDLVSKVFPAHELVINGRRIRSVVLRGPSRELVELISFGRG